MPLIYSFVSRGNTVLADYTSYTGNFSTVALQALEKGAQGANAKFTYSCDGHTFNYLTSNGYSEWVAKGGRGVVFRLPLSQAGTAASLLPVLGAALRMLLLMLTPHIRLPHPIAPAFLVVADEQFGRQIPFAFLEKVREEWQQKWAEKGPAAAAHSLDKSFGPRLKYWMEYCEQHPEELSKVASVQKKVDEVKNIMVDNIEKVLERGEKIELLVDKTDNLRFQADKFHKTGRQLRSRMWWQNMKMKLIVVFILILIAVIIFCAVCFSGGKRCF
jgi:vesicle-associated membrane protein 7